MRRTLAAVAVAALGFAVGACGGGKNPAATAGLSQTIRTETAAVAATRSVSSPTTTPTKTSTVTETVTRTETVTQTQTATVTAPAQTVTQAVTQTVTTGHTGGAVVAAGAGAAAVSHEESGGGTPGWVYALIGGLLGAALFWGVTRLRRR